MKKVLISLLFGAFIFTGISYAQTPPPAQAPVVAASEGVKPAHREKHPELHKAMHKLRDAKQTLEKAGHEYGGHKAKAVAAINEALQEVQAALDTEKK